MDAVVLALPLPGDDTLALSDALFDASLLNDALSEGEGEVGSERLSDREGEEVAD